MSERDDGMEGLNAQDPDMIAAAWFHRLAAAKGTAKDETRQLFQAWLDANPDHAEAFARTTAAWNEIGAHATTPEMMGLRQAAISDSRRAGLARWRPISSPRQSRGWAALAASLIAVTAFGSVGYFLLGPARPQSYVTEIGERQVVTLADNSRVDIDADSAIAVDFTPERRLVHVVRGQAYFAVEKDPGRPFIVESNGRNVIATGTMFDVEKLDDGVRVTLVEGHVTVRRASSDTTTGPTEDLTPNDQLTDETGKRPVLVHLASTLSATAWRQGKLLFTDEPLADAVARVNRYSHVQVVADPTIAGIRIGGAFDAGDVTAFVDALKAYYPISAVSDRPGQLRLVGRRGDSVRY